MYACGGVRGVADTHRVLHICNPQEPQAMRQLMQDDGKKIELISRGVSVGASVPAREETASPAD